MQPHVGTKAQRAWRMAVPCLEPVLDLNTHAGQAEVVGAGQAEQAELVVAWSQGSKKGGGGRLAASSSARGMPQLDPQFGQPATGRAAPLCNLSGACRALQRPPRGPGPHPWPAG